LMMAMMNFIHAPFCGSWDREEPGARRSTQKACQNPKLARSRD